MRAAMSLLFVSLWVQGASVSWAQAPRMTWSDAIAPLASLQTQAKNCAAVLKRVGNQGQRDLGQLTYGKAKGDADAVIAGLLAAVTTGGNPASLTTLQARLASSTAGLEKFCNETLEIVKASIPPGQVTRDVWSQLSDIVGIKEILKRLPDAVGALYADYRSDTAATRQGFRSQLEAMKWPDFATVESQKD